jgi:hypothetical protein
MHERPTIATSEWAAQALFDASPSNLTREVQAAAVRDCCALLCC